MGTCDPGIGVFIAACALFIGFGGGLLAAAWWRLLEETRAPRKILERKLERAELMRKGAEVQCERMRQRWLHEKNMKQPAAVV